MNYTTKRDADRLFKLCLKGDAMALRDALPSFLAKGGDIEVTNSSQCTLLMESAWYGRQACIKELLHYGADANSRDNCGNTALIYCAYTGHSNCIKPLVEAGADINATTTRGYTALMEAADAGHIKYVHTIIQIGADVNMRTINGWNAYMLAASSGHINIMEALVAAGTDMSNIDMYIDKTGPDVGYRTALMTALNAGHYEAACILVSLGADIYSRDNKGRAAIEYCENSKYKEQLINFYTTKRQTQQAIDSVDKPDIVAGFDSER